MESYLKITLLCSMMWYVSNCFAEIDPVISFSIGRDKVKAAKDQVVTLNDTFTPLAFGQNRYAPFDGYQSTDIYGGFIGIEIPFQKRSIWQVGAGWYASNSFDVKGDIYEYNNVNYKNFEYKYKINYERIMLENKYFLKLYEYFLPYVYLGLGYAKVRAYDYEDFSLSDEISTYQFTDGTNEAFAWGVGLGLEVRPFEFISIGIGYRFFDMGEVKLGRSEIQTTNNTPNQEPFQANEWVGQVSLIF